ncbi:MAG: tol-pal system protein YbgF [Gammaproteobacteria bacterium]|nr:tol-pal system protein YbgF [Gammaproteobacteria bacterium]
MIFELIKASRSVFKTGSFLFALIFLSSVISAAEVTRSLSLEDRVRILEQQLSSANRMRAESQFEITNLQNEVRALRGLVEEQGYQLQQIITRQREFYRDIDQRMGQINNSDTPVNVTVPKETISDNQNSSISDVVINDKPVAISESNEDLVVTTTVPIVDDTQIRAEYDQIFPLVRGKRYDDAIAGYQQFIAKYPDSIFVANSRYWLAQIYSVQGRTDESEREYLNVAQQYATSPKAPDAWLKLGKLYETKGESDKALNAYNHVVTEYSTSTAAQMAVNRLQALKSSN